MKAMKNHHEAQANSPQKFIRLRAVMSMTGMAKGSIYRLAADGAFPKPLKLSERSSAWIESDVAAWIQSRIEASRLAAA